MSANTPLEPEERRAGGIQRRHFSEAPSGEVVSVRGVAVAWPEAAYERRSQVWEGVTVRVRDG